MYKIMIYLENSSMDDCLNLIEASNVIASNKKEYEIVGVGFNLNEEKCIGKLDTLINIKDEISLYDTMNISKCIQEVINKYEFNAILISANTVGRMLAPRIAMGLHSGIVADVTELEVTDEDVIMIRPAFDGKIMAGITSIKDKPIVMSIRPGIFTYTHKHDKQTIIKEHIRGNKKSEKFKVISKVKKSESQDIRDSKFLISFGGGVQSDFDKIYDLAKLCEANVSASRRSVDSGYARRAIQVGQSGKVVTPKVYIALGIYGSIQHVEGLKNVETIISVNTDSKAAICYLSDIVVEGDALEFVEKLSLKIEEEKVKNQLALC